MVVVPDQDSDRGSGESPEQIESDSPEPIESAGRVGPRSGSFADVVIVSNRGPLSFAVGDDDELVSLVSAGGLAGSIQPLVAGSGAIWVSCALSDADRKAAAAGEMSGGGVGVELIEPDPGTFQMAYDVVSNATLWFCHHHLFDGSRRPRGDRHWSEAWEGYRRFNRLFAERVAAVAPPGGRVLVQDYHLVLVAPILRELRPDLRVVHFSHTPFADPSVLAMLPESVVTELLDGMAAFRACGFHTSRWQDGYLACQAELGHHEIEAGGAVRREDGAVQATFVSPLTTDVATLGESASHPAVAAARAVLEDEIGGRDRQVIVRVDRMELSKNLLRGFWAFEELLETRPEWCERVVFLALAYPSRQGLAEYLAYQNEVESTVARINERWSRPGWTPIVLHVEDDYHRSLAALQRYDVLLVNPVRDGMNLVAKEGPLLNERAGVLVLSREAGAAGELGPGALVINPFDVSETAGALHEALIIDPGTRGSLQTALQSLVSRRTPLDWLEDQLAFAGD